MKPLTIFFELNFTTGPDHVCAIIPGWHDAPFKEGRFRRVWWLCFAVAWVRMDLHDYNRYVASGATEWRNPPAMANPLANKGRVANGGELP